MLAVLRCILLHFAVFRCPEHTSPPAIPPFAAPPTRAENRYNLGTSEEERWRGWHGKGNFRWRVLLVFGANLRCAEGRAAGHPRLRGRRRAAAVVRAGLHRPHRTRGSRPDHI